MTQASPRLVLVGRLAGAFGVRGEVRISAYTERPGALLDYAALVREDGSPGLTLLSGRVAKGDVIARVREIDTKEQADAMRGLRLFVPRQALPAVEDDEYYLTDLIGLPVETPQGAPVGRIRSVQNFGAGDLLEIQPPAGAAWWLPFTREAVPTVDIAGGRVVVVRPDETE
ncbi:16S rRNA processing protein RimM [Caulobacter sp. CCUG 60055]|nr:ribosome maturation factor RimM [Caulobacter sp. CCUG 60055]MBQ1543341.1 16S rRNA processing protein RimM [Caulobacteraceae bacterium]MCI3179761.1 16S rRNA processing protein RimM [Caulobacter sp. CCUG 60055]